MFKLMNSSWYMVGGIENLLNKLWVKNVNNVRKLSSKNGVYSSTVISFLLNTGIGLVEKVAFIHQTFNRFLYLLSTQIFYSNNLLMTGYTHNPQALLIRTKRKN
jgi:hypothetical protein